MKINTPVTHRLFPAIIFAIFSLNGSTVLAQDPTEQNFSTVEERRLFQQIEDERVKLREGTKELELKKKELKSLEETVDKKLARLDEKLIELSRVQKKLEELLQLKSAEEEQKTKDLAKIYEKMIPQRAALAITGLESQLAANLLAAMKAKSAAKILDQITRLKATELSTQFSKIKIE